MRCFAPALLSLLILGCNRDSEAESLDRAESTPSPPTGYCETVANLAGTWRFDTTVIGAQDLAPRGINGHYEASVTVDGCTASIELRKTGYDSVRYTEKKIQVSTAAPSESKRIPHAAEATFSLEDQPTHTITFLVRDGQLFGFWQSTGREWERAGMWGFLRGVRPEQDLAKVEDFAAQPCEVACLTQCDAPRRQADDRLDEPQLAACLTACASQQPIVGCGSTPIPDELVLELHGPRESLDAVCQAAATDLLAKHGSTAPASTVVCGHELRVGAKPARRNLSTKALAGSFQAAELLEVGGLDTDYFGELVLALETEAGWYYTEPLVDLSGSRAAGVTRELTAAVVRARDLLSPAGREVLVELTLRTTDNDPDVNEVAQDEQQHVVLCSIAERPICTQVPVGWASKRKLLDAKSKPDPADHADLHDRRGQLYLSVLPGDLVSISAPANASEQDVALTGIHAWPTKKAP